MDQADKYIIEQANRAYQFYEWKKAFEFYSSVDERTHNGHVCYRLGIMYDKGYYVKKNKEKAEHYFARALEKLRQDADAGDSDAQCDIGYMYANACGQAQDDGLAVMYYQLGADQGNPRAQCNLGFMYDSGKGIKHDNFMAAKLYKLSADQGYSVAKCNLGYMFQWGYGVTQDYKMMLNCYMSAADMANPRAQGYMADIFCGCEGEEIQQLASIEWNNKIRGIILSWPASHSWLCLPCKCAVVEILCIVKNNYQDLGIPVEMILLVAKMLVVVWDHPNPYRERSTLIEFSSEEEFIVDVDDGGVESEEEMMDEVYWEEI